MYVIRRSSHNPLLAPTAERPWEARGTFNPSPIKHRNVTHVLYRAQGRPDALMAPGGISTIGKALSLDGEHFQSRRQLIVPQESWDKYGCEDPRVTFFEGKHVIFYTALGGMPFNAGNIKVAVALSKDLEKIDERHLVTPFNAKAMALFPERIGKKITVIFTAHTDEPPWARIGIAQCNKLEELWDVSFWEKWHGEMGENLINLLRFDSDHVEIGSAPIKTPDGWLLFFSYMQNYFKGESDRLVGIEAVLLDLKDPYKIVAKSKGPIMVPEEVYEHYGLVPNTIFPSGAIMHKNGLVDIYYGGADTVCAKASLYLPDFLDSIIPERRSELVTRAKENPIITPIPSHDWESRSTFNAAAIDLGGKIHLVYRAMSSDNTSVFGYASTKNGAKITDRLETPMYVPRGDFEMKKSGPDGFSGCEDPRITELDGTLYMTYTAFNGVDPTHVALTTISVKDFLAKKFDKWTMPVLTTPDDVDDKNMCLFPEKIGGQYMLLHRIAGQLCADYLDDLDFTKKRLTRCIEIMGPRKGMWDSEKIGITGPPIKTKYGWLLLYHGVSRTKTYRLGAVLLDLKNPGIVLARTVDPILEPTESYEKEGDVKNVVFSCGVVQRKDTLYIYYGGADKVLAVATVSFKKLLGKLDPIRFKEKND